MASKQKPELKYFQFSQNGILAATPALTPIILTPLSGIAQGVGSSNRLGRQIRIHRIRSTVVLTSVSNADIMSVAAAILPEDEEPAATLFPSQGNGVARWATPSVTRVLKESAATVAKYDGGSGNAIAVWEGDFNLNMTLKYTAAGTVQGADYALAAMAERLGATTFHKFEVWFTDL